MAMLRNFIAAATIVSCIGLPQGTGQDPSAARTYLVKLSVPVSTERSKPGDRVRAAIISPESLLNGYLEGTVHQVSSDSAGRLVLRFTNVLYKGKSTPIEAEVIDFVNSKGHKSVDDNERPITLRDGGFSSAAGDLWLDEGAELRVRAAPPRK
jgi:hypothetical protein